MITDLLTGFAVVALASAAMGAILEYVAQALHDKHHDPH